MPLTPGRINWEDSESEASLGNLVRPSLKIKMFLKSASVERHVIGNWSKDGRKLG